MDLLQSIWKKLIQFFKGTQRTYKEIRSNTEQTNTIIGGINIDINPVAEVKEAQWFTRKNNLVEEGSWSETVISSSRFGSYDSSTGKDLDFYGKEINTEEKPVYESEVPKEKPEELLQDDIEFLKSHPDYAKPEVPKEQIKDYVLKPSDINLENKN